MAESVPTKERATSTLPRANEDYHPNVIEFLRAMSEQADGTASGAVLNRILHRSRLRPGMTQSLAGILRRLSDGPNPIIIVEWKSEARTLFSRITLSEFGRSWLRNYVPAEARIPEAEVSDATEASSAPLTVVETEWYVRAMRRLAQANPVSHSDIERVIRLRFGAASTPERVRMMKDRLIATGIIELQPAGRGRVFLHVGPR